MVSAAASGGCGSHFGTESNICGSHRETISKGMELEFEGARETHITVWLGCVEKV